MKNKVEVKKIQKKQKKCYFCGTDKNLTKHHIIFKEFTIGVKLTHNKEYLCKRCHEKFHKLVKPVIQFLLGTIKKLATQEQPKPMRKIGFIRTNGK